MKKSFFIIGAVLATFFVGGLSSYFLARCSADRVIERYDPMKTNGLYYYRTSIVFDGWNTPCWRVAYGQDGKFNGDPVIVYVTPLGGVISSRPAFIAKQPKK